MQDSDNFRVESCLQDEIIRVTVSGSLGEGDLQKFGNILKKALAHKNIILDLTSLEYVCSWGFGMLVEKSQFAAEKSARLVVVRPKTKLNKLFEMLCLDELLEIFASFEDAFSSFQIKSDI